MECAEPVELVAREPVAVRELVGFFGEEVIFDHHLFERRKRHHHLKWDSAAKILVDIDHALINLSVVLKIIDKTVVEREPRNAHASGNSHRKRHDAHAPGPVLREVPQLTDQARRRLFGSRCFAAFEQHQECREDGERSQEGERDTEAHHPAEVLDRRYVAHRQRAERSDGGERGVEARREFADEGLQDQRFAARSVFGRGKLAVANDQVDRQRDGHDDQK